MIHSGSANGGHYYAYIKSFAENQWYSFNDQNVQRITPEDVHKTFGGPSGMRYTDGNKIEDEEEVKSMA